MNSSAIPTTPRRSTSRPSSTISLTLQHRIHRGRPVADVEARETLKHLARLWGFSVRLEGVREDGGVEYCQECRVQ